MNRNFYAKQASKQASNAIIFLLLSFCDEETDGCGDLFSFVLLLCGDLHDLFTLFFFFSWRHGLAWALQSWSWTWECQSDRLIRC